MLIRLVNGLRYSNVCDHVAHDISAANITSLLVKARQKFSTWNLPAVIRLGFSSILVNIRLLVLFLKISYI